MRVRIAVPEEHVSPEVVDAALEAVTRLDQHLLEAGQSPTSEELVARGAVWRPEPPGDEHFDHGATIASRGWGDCDDWAPLRAATLRHSGEDPGAVARVVPSGPSTFHAMVQRGSGEFEAGEHDISARAGMQPLSVVGAGGDMQVWALDPHDGRVYQGALAPTVGPLSLTRGLHTAVRGAHVVGVGTFYEGRVDVPLIGSRWVHVKSYRRHRPHGPRRRVHGGAPYALSSTCWGADPGQALAGALCGALYCGQVTGMVPAVDRYKLLAAQAAMGGMSPGEVREYVIDLLQKDLGAHAAATGEHPQVHTHAMLSQLASEGHIDGYYARSVGGFFDDIGHIASGVVNAVKDVVSKVGPWAGTILHGVQAITSVIPGVGTVVSDVLATAESAYDELAAILGGNPLEGAIKAAYNFATATVPGASALRFILDPVVNTLLAMVMKKEPVETSLMNGLLGSVPDVPKFGPVSPRSIASTLAHLIVSHLGAKKSPAGAKVLRPAPLPPHLGGIAPGPIAIHPDPAVHAQVLAKSHAMGASAPSRPIRLTTRPAVQAARGLPPHPALPAATFKPPGAAHAATPARPSALPHPTAWPAPSLAPSSPGAPPGATHWRCMPLPSGQWACSWQ